MSGAHAAGALPAPAVFFANEQIAAVAALAVRSTCSRSSSPRPPGARSSRCLKVESPTSLHSSWPTTPSADIRSFRWVDDDWLIYNVIDLQAPGNDQAFGPGLFSVRRDGTGARLLIRCRLRRRRSPSTQVTATNVLGPYHGLLFVPRERQATTSSSGSTAFDGLRDLARDPPEARSTCATGRSRPIAIRPSRRRDRMGVRPCRRAACGANGGHRGCLWRCSGAAPRSGCVALAHARRRRSRSPWYPLAVDMLGTAVRRPRPRPAPRRS